MMTKEELLQAINAYEAWELERGPPYLKAADLRSTCLALYEREERLRAALMDAVSTLEWLGDAYEEERRTRPIIKKALSALKELPEDETC